MTDADWTFGGGSFAKIYGDRLAESSLLECSVATRWVFVYMLARADFKGRFRCATVEGLARAAAVSVEDATRAVSELEAPDPDSTSADEDGRRIVRIGGGWQIVTYLKYRDYRTPKQVADADRQKRHRERDMSRDVTHRHSDVAVDIRHQTPDTRERITPPTPSRGIKTSIHPDTDAATTRVLLAFNGTFKRRATPLPKLKGEVSRRLREGYTVEQLASVPILADAQTDFPDFRKNAKVHWFLRTGENPRTGQDGRTTGGKDWIGDSLNAAFGTTLWPHHVEAAQAAGVLESLLKLGAKPSQ